MKKIFVLVIAFVVIGVTIVPVVWAQDVDMKKLEALEKELEQLEAKAERGQQLTPKEMERLYQIRDELHAEAIKAAGPHGDMVEQYLNQSAGQQPPNQKR